MAPSGFPPYSNDGAEESPEETARAKEAAQFMVDLYLYIGKRMSYRGFDDMLMNNLKLVAASGHPGNPTADPPIRASAHPSTVWEFHADSAYANLNQVVHGGAIALVMDMTSTTALCPIQSTDYWDFMGGVSRALNISYLKAIPTDTTLRIRSWVVQHGKSLALIRSQMESVDGKIVYATCEHHKFSVPTVSGYIQLRDEMLAEKRKKQESEGKAKL